LQGALATKQSKKINPTPQSLRRALFLPVFARSLGDEAIQKDKIKLDCFANARKDEEKETAMTKKKWKDEEKNSQKQKTKEKNQIKPSQKKLLKPKFSKKILGTFQKSFLILSTFKAVFLFSLLSFSRRREFSNLIHHFLPSIFCEEPSFPSSLRGALFPLVFTTNSLSPRLCEEPSFPSSLRGALATKQSRKQIKTGLLR
jgi:hypothetical protein